jgi:hypothetical protein
MLYQLAARAIFAFCAMAFLAHAAPAYAAMQPGLWAFTQQTTGTRPKRTTRCVRPAEAADPVRYFAPRAGRQSGHCELVENTASTARISSRVRCTTGQSSSELSSIINMDTPQHMTITTTLSTSAGGKSSNVGMRGEGKRIGDCR